MTMITPSYLGETIEYSSLHACRSTLEDPTTEGQADIISPTTPVALMPEGPTGTTVTQGPSNQNSSASIAPILLAVGGAGAFLFGGHSSSSVPEPASILVMVSALTALRYRRKSK